MPIVNPLPWDGFCRKPSERVAAFKSAREPCSARAGAMKQRPSRKAAAFARLQYPLIIRILPFPAVPLGRHATAVHKQKLWAVKAIYPALGRNYAVVCGRKIPR